MPEISSFDFTAAFTVKSFCFSAAIPEAESVSTLRVQLNDNYAICIDNGYLLSSREWEAIIETIKGYMAYEPVIL
jgi:hypothetical protein